MENQTEQTEIVALTKVVSESGLQLTEAEAIKQSYLPYFEQLGEIKTQALKINFEEPTAIDEMLARELRLMTVKVRTGSEKIKEERKKGHMLKANVEQAAWNLIKATCQLDEDRFVQVEKKRENEEKARKEALKQVRLGELEQYKDLVQFEFIDLGEISEESYQNILKGAVLARKAQQEEEAAKIKEQEELDRMRAAEAEAQRLENERIRKENEELQVKIEEEKKRAAAEIEEQKRIQDEKDRVANEAAAKQAAEIAAAKEEARILQEKIDTEAKLKREAEEKAAAEKRAEELAEAKRARLAAKAPDKEKIKKEIESLQLPVLMLTSPEMAAHYLEINEKLNAFKAWSFKQLDLN